jgi:hypothetical protein
MPKEKIYLGLKVKIYLGLRIRIFLYFDLGLKKIAILAWVRIFLLFWLKINKNLALRLTIRFKIRHSKKFLKNISQNAWKIFISLRIFILPNIFWADYIGWFFFIFAEEFGKSTNPLLGNIHEIFFLRCLKKFQAILEILTCLGKL